MAREPSISSDPGYQPGYQQISTYCPGCHLPKHPRDVGTQLYEALREPHLVIPYFRGTQTILTSSLYHATKTTSTPY